MPCDQVRTVSVDMSKANIHVLKDALEKMGYRVEERMESLYLYDKNGYTQRGSYVGGKLTFNASGWEKTPDINDVRRNYAAAAVEATQKKFSLWNVTKQSESKYTLRRGY
jgi:hypothetical protein